MIRKSRILFVLLLCAAVFAPLTPSRAAEPTGDTAQYIQQAERIQQEAESSLDSLQKALAAAQRAGDTLAVQELNADIRQVEVRLGQILQQVALVRQAPTPQAAAAALQNAVTANAQVASVIRNLPPAITQTYVKPFIAATTTATTVAATTVPPTTVWTTTTTTSSSTSVSPASR